MKNTIKKQIITNKILMITVLFSFILVLISISGVNAAPTVYVNSTGGSDDNDGSIEHPYKTICKGINKATENGTIRIANGIYSGENNTNITIIKNMTIIGQSQKKTIINGTGTNWIFKVNSGVTVTLTNLTLTNATADLGGAIENYGTLTLINCTFTNNKANGFGGAICNWESNISLSSCTFTNNTATSGGAIYHYQGTISLSSCTFTNNTATTYGGGAITNQDTITSLNSCTFTNNTATNAGGAIGNGGTISSLSGCTFNNNTANKGGAIYNSGTITSLINCKFNNNRANYNGGAIYNRGTLNANYNRFYNNNAPSGNAIYCIGGSVNANYNWWSSNKDPKTIPNLIVENDGSVDASTWVILTVKANPKTINNTQKSTITADFNHINGGGKLIGGHIPDEHITLNVPWGSFTSSRITHSITMNTVDGAANAIFYANERAMNTSYNPVKVTALADGYATNDTESDYITINKTAKLYLKTTNSNNNPKVDETFTITYKLGNKGPDAAENVTITFQIPEGLNFVNIQVDTGKYTYDPITRTVTWKIESVPVGDPYLYLTVQAAGDGTYKITPSITSATYNLNSGDLGIITINVQPNNNNGNSNNENTVKAASKTTVGLQDTGLPLNYLILAVLMVLSGLVPKRK